jgi:Trk K+ transport system NAD-binding subunit
VPERLQSRLATTSRRRRVRGWLARRIRATQHHVEALLREFRGPLVGFVALAVGGGWAYGELYAFARGIDIPHYDRPYVMLQLMLLEAPETVPPEWYLAAFWYALPLAFIVLVGLGAADFLELFFNRGDDDRNRWQEALAMTYRNHAIVLGAGHVGLRVVRDLTDLGQEVVVVDQDPHVEALDALEVFGVPVVRGDARMGSVLERASLAQADVFVACTGNDHINMEAVMKARELNPGARMVARVWDRSLGEHMERYGMADQVLSAADLSAPAFAGAALGIDISQTVEVAGVEYSSLRLTAAPGSFLTRDTVGAIERSNDLEVSLVAHEGSVTVDPEPGARIAPGDEVVLFARHSRILEVVTRNRRGRE